MACHSKVKPFFQYQTHDRMFGLAGVFGIYKCGCCGLLSLRPKLTKEKLVHFYPSDTYYSYTNNKSIFLRLRSILIRFFYHPTLFTKILFLFINTVPAIPKRKVGGRIMDVGCGSGETLRILKKYGWDAYGIDIDKKAVLRAQKSGLDKVFFGSYQKLGTYKNKYFDVIRAYHVIEHMDSPVRFLALAKKKLKDDGELILGTPNSESVLEKVFRSYWYNLDTPRHLYVFSPKTLVYLLGQAHFETADLRFCSGGGWLGSIQYVLSDILKKNVRFIENPLVFFLFYPLDKLSDTMRTGDVFVLTARK